MWLRHALNIALTLLVVSACSPSHKDQVDKLNSLSYDFHYRSLDSTEHYAARAYSLAVDDADGRAEALNNMAFVSIMRMEYDSAQALLDQVYEQTDNEIELLIADIQQMRLCQRRSENKAFHEHREQARKRLVRIDEERNLLDERELQRMVYAESEYAIVNSTYYYYVGLERQSIDAINDIDPNGDIQTDLGQWLSYLYNVGAGGIIVEGTSAEIQQQEFDYLLRCYLTARQYGIAYYEANSLEALSEHLMVLESRLQLINDNLPAMKFLNPQQVNDDELPIWLANQSLNIFTAYGDVYQIAGAHRTLASCYHAADDDVAALDELNLALSVPRISQAPDLIASIREQLSVAYAAVNDKLQSDQNRNLYLDLQKQTRQDRSLEARTDQYNKTAQQLNYMIWAVIIAICLLLLLLWIFNRLHRRQNDAKSMDVLLTPLRQWQQQNAQQEAELKDRIEEINEAYQLNLIHIRNNERRCLEARAKLSLVNSIMPFIDRIIHEANRLREGDPEHRQERLQYIRELTDQINAYNEVLTHWITLQKGQLSSHIESFQLQPLFDMINRGKATFAMKGIELNVEPTTAVVKADRVLTLFMLNTLADNARKFTSAGGQVTISASETDDYVELSVADTGQGMDADQLEHVFDRNVISEKSQQSHGFGLINCRGIIEKYRKLSHIFSICLLSAESVKGQGSRFFFRLPKGVVRVLVMGFGLLVWGTHISIHGQHLTGRSAQPVYSVKNSQPSEADTLLGRAYIYADSAYFSNINGRYERTLHFADSCRYYLNLHYLHLHPHGQLLMEREGSLSALAPEIQWYHDHLDTNYSIILDIRNESAVAALALHQWGLYAYNNKVYTQLFKEMSADNTLEEYCRMMQQSQTNKTIAVILLLIVLASILPAYYLLYYRHRLYYRFCVERIKAINGILLEDASPAEKLRRISPLASTDYPEELSSVVHEIIQALRQSIDDHEQQAMNVELAADECRRTEMENSNLHVSNAVLDNCLSTLKHETMYYPSRIRQLVTADSADASSIYELVNYYRELYSILSQQAMRQLDKVKIHLQPLTLYGQTVLGDENLLGYMFELLNRNPADISATVKDTHYVTYDVRMPQLHLTSEQAHELFMPAVNHINYLLCRQIVRDHSEATNRRGCGILAQVDEQQQTVIQITLPRWNHSKSLS